MILLSLLVLGRGFSFVGVVFMLVLFILVMLVHVVLPIKNFYR